MYLLNCFSLKKDTHEKIIVVMIVIVVMLLYPWKKYCTEKIGYRNLMKNDVLLFSNLISPWNGRFIPLVLITIEMSAGKITEREKATGSCAEMTDDGILIQ